MRGQGHGALEEPVPRGPGPSNRGFSGAPCSKQCRFHFIRGWKPLRGPGSSSNPGYHAPPGSFHRISKNSWGLAKADPYWGIKICMQECHTHIILTNVGVSEPCGPYLLPHQILNTLDVAIRVIFCLHRVATGILCWSLKTLTYWVFTVSQSIRRNLS